MFSVTPEPPVSAPTYGSRARQERLDPPSDGFSALVDSSTTAADTDHKPQAPTSDSPRSEPRDDRRNEAAASKDSASPDASAAPADSPAAKADRPVQVLSDDTTPSDEKVSGITAATKDKKADGEKAPDDTTDSVTAQAATPVTDIVAIVTAIAAVPESAATPPTPTTEPQPAPAAIAAAAVATAAAVAEATGPVTSQAAAKSGIPAETDLAAAAAELHLTPPDDTEVVSDGATVLAPKTAAAAADRPGVSIKSADDAVSGKHVAEASPTTTLTPDQADKPASDGAATGSISAQDGKPAQNTKSAHPAKEATGDAKTDGTDAPADSGKATPQPEHRTQAAAASFHTALQPDQIPQPPSSPSQQPLQTHPVNLTAVAVSPAQATLMANTPVPVSGLAVDIALRAAGGNSRFEIRLDPAELGRIDVRLDVDKHGNVTSHLTVERPATLDMLRKDAPQLQQALEDAGLKTGGTGLQFSLRDQSSSGRDSHDHSGRNSQHLLITEDETVPAQVAGRSYGRMLSSSGGVDIRI